MSSVDIRISKDGGRNFGDWKKRDLGETGDFLTPAIVRRLGRSRQWLIEWRVTDPVRADLIAVAVQAESER